MREWNFVAPTTGTYVIQAGCFGSGACTGTVTYNDCDQRAACAERGRLATDRSAPDYHDAASRSTAGKRAAIQSMKART